MLIYADNAATTAVSKKALEAMLPYFTEHYGNASSIHRVGQEANKALQQARAEIAAILGAEPKELIFISGGSESDNQAIISAALQGAKKGKKHIISSKIEHHAVLHVLDKLEKEGYDITLLDVSPEGLVSPESVEKAIREDTALVTIMFANNEIGTIEPIKEIGEICRKHGVIFHTDAVQAVGHVPINVKEMNIDMLSFSAHKFHGPKGIGGLYVRKGIRLLPLIEGGAQEKGLRAGTENVAAVVGMAAALKEQVENMEKNAEKLTKMRDRLIDSILKEVPRVRLNGDRVKRLPGNVNFCFEGIEGEALLLMLDNLGICGSSGSACTSGSLDPSHVLLAIGLPHEIAHGSLRLTFSEYNTEEEIDYIIKAIPQVVKRLRDMSPMWERIVKEEA